MMTGGMEDAVVIGGLMAVQFIYAGNSALLSYLMSLGLNPLTVVICFASATSLFLSPLAVYFERGKLYSFVGHFLLTNLLMETMKKTVLESKKEGRIVNLSSEGHRLTYGEGIRFDKINDESEYRTILAYGQSKLSNILHAKELARRLKEEGIEITANALHPGAIATNLLRFHGFINAVTNSVAKFVLKNVRQGAATQCYVALNPQVKGVSGEYFVDSNIANPTSHAKDMELAKKLWDFSVNLTSPK